MSLVIVTGANGLLGTNVIIELLSRGYSVRGLLRNINDFHYKKHSNLELIQGDFTNKQTVAAAIKGCDYVIHVAAIARHNLPRYSRYKHVNAAATENLVQLAVKENLKKFVYISTANAFGYGTMEKPGNENMKIKKPFSESYYVKSKIEAQQSVLNHRDEISVIIVNPTWMLGAYDSKPSSGKIILMGLRKVIFYPPGGKNFVHVQDVAKGIVNALEAGNNGEAYLLANENLSYKEFFKKVSALTNRHPLYIKIPRFLLFILGVFGDCFRAMGIKSSISLNNMKMVCVDNFYSNNKATAELNLTFQPTEKSIEDAINWFNERKVK